MGTELALQDDGNAPTLGTPVHLFRAILFAPFQDSPSLRTPLNGILALSEALQDEIYGPARAMRFPLGLFI